MQKPLCQIISSILYLYLFLTLDDPYKKIRQTKHFRPVENEIILKHISRQKYTHTQPNGDKWGECS